MLFRSVGACALIAETLAWTTSHGLSLYELLIEIYLKFGFYKESLLSVTRKGQAGAQEIKQMMVDYRLSPPVEINGSKVIRIKDYNSLAEKDLLRGTTEPINLPKSDVLQFFTEAGSVISVRPSGTEPKIKFYFGVRENLAGKPDFAATGKKLNDKLQGIITSLNLQ